MRFSTSPPRGRLGRRLGCAILIFAGSVTWIARPEPGAPALAASWTPTARLDVGGGAESDLILDPSLDASVVAGGSFAEVTPWLSLDGRLSSTTRLRLHARATFERFFNADARWLSSQSLGLDLMGAGPGVLRWRLSAGQNFFDDSQRDTVQRLGGWTELGVGPSFGRAAVELATTLGGRRYPDLITVDDVGALGTYDDWSRTLRGTAYFDLGSGAWLRAGSEHTDTFARDPLFDSNAWLHFAGLGATLGDALEIQASAMLQRRTFERRVPIEDDEYLYASLAATYQIDPRLALLAQAGVYRYTWPDGSHEDSQRAMLGLRLTWGSASPDVRADLPTRPPEPWRHESAALFRIRAPQASTVSVVGTFNGWDATAHRLRATDDGWWELSVALAPGEYQYGYLVDGVFVTPPEAQITVDDGFGGRNGWMEILASP